VQGLNPPRGRWPPDQLAGAEGQGHPQLLWAAAARPGLVFSSLHAAVGILLIGEELNAKDRVLARKGRRRRNTSDGRRPGSPRIGWPAGHCQGRPHGCQDVPTVEDRVAASVEVSKATGHRRRRAATRVTPNWTAGGPLPGSHFLSTASLRSHHLLDSG